MSSEPLFSIGRNEKLSLASLQAFFTSELRCWFMSTLPHVPQLVQQLFRLLTAKAVLLHEVVPHELVPRIPCKGTLAKQKKGSAASLGTIASMQTVGVFRQLALPTPM